MGSSPTPQRSSPSARPGFGWRDVSTLKEPGRLEGKKTLGYEIAGQMGWRVPDVIVYPTGGGTGLIGIWKALDELEALGWIGRKRPRMSTRFNRRDARPSSAPL